MEGWICGKEKKGIPESNHHQKKGLVYPPPSSTSPLLSSIPRGTKAALLCLLRSSPTGHPYPVHQPLPGPGHHLHHLHQRHHHVSGALQPAPGEVMGVRTPLGVQPAAPAAAKPLNMSDETALT